MKKLTKVKASRRAKAHTKKVDCSPKKKRPLQGLHSQEEAIRMLRRNFGTVPEDQGLHTKGKPTKRGGNRKRI